MLKKMDIEEDEAYGKLAHEALQRFVDAAQNLGMFISTRMESEGFATWWSIYLWQLNYLDHERFLRLVKAPGNMGNNGLLDLLFKPLPKPATDPTKRTRRKKGGK